MTKNSCDKINVSIIGATGYLGGELIRLLINHQYVDMCHLTSNSCVGKAIAKLHPNLQKMINASFDNFDLEDVAATSDVVFCAVPHGVALGVVPDLLEANSDIKIIDLSADFRINNTNTYEKWYGVKHAAKKWLKKAVYGIPELYKKEIAKTRLVANPGCYPTSAILALAPLLTEGAVDKKSIIIDSMSGASGAGRNLSQQIHFPECNENIKAYSITAHRHTPEIEQELTKLAKEEVIVSFTPHLAPMNRGILTTIYCNIDNDCTKNDLWELYAQWYENSEFVRILNPGIWPETRWVKGTNFCDINITIDKHAKRAIIVSAIDNLI
ncbi:MAG: N-acetyl-gamma-glutamyl-phosphate reductase, partial [Candidatus Methanofastidiosia archaeon]